MNAINSIIILIRVVLCFGFIIYLGGLLWVGPHISKIGFCLSLFISIFILYLLYTMSANKLNMRITKKDLIFYILGILVVVIGLTLSAFNFILAPSFSGLFITLIVFLICILLKTTKSSS